MTVDEAMRHYEHYLLRRPSPIPDYLLNSEFKTDVNDQKLLQMRYPMPND